MKILVTGREGQLARSMLERLSGRDEFEVVAVGRPELDFEMLETIPPAVAAHGPDIIINAAAYTAVDQAEDEPERAFRINAEAAGEMAEAARAVGARFIQISTDYVFDGRSAQPYDENATTNPLGIYGRSKLEGEERVRTKNPDSVIVRTAWVYSPFGRNFVKTMMALAHNHDRVRVVADQRGSPSSALDIANGLLAMLSDWQQGGATGLGRTYHLAGGGIATWAEFAEVIFDHCRQFGLPAATVDPIASADWPAKAERPISAVLDCARFDMDFGYRMPEWRRSVGETIRRIADAGARS